MKCTSCPRRASSSPSSVATAPEPPPPPPAHAARRATPPPVDPGRAGCPAARKTPPYLVHESRGEHLLHPLSDATVQRVPRQRELNVPRPHRPGRARVLLPPAQSSPGEQRNFDGPTRPLPPTAPEPTVEARGPMGEPRRREVRRPGAQPLAPRGVERRLVEQTLGQRAYVQPGPDRKSTRLNSSHGYISYAVFCLKKKKTTKTNDYHH